MELSGTGCSWSKGWQKKAQACKEDGEGAGLEATEKCSRDARLLPTTPLFVFTHPCQNCGYKTFYKTF